MRWNCQIAKRHCHQSKKCEWCGQQWMPELQSCRLCQTMQGAWAARSTVGLPKLQVRFLATRQEVRVVWPTVALPERCRHCQQCKKREWCGERVDCQSCITGIASSARSVGGAGNRGGVRAADIGASKKCELVRAIVGYQRHAHNARSAGGATNRGIARVAKLPQSCRRCHNARSASGAAAWTKQQSCWHLPAMQEEWCGQQMDTRAAKLPALPTMQGVWVAAGWCGQQWDCPSFECQAARQFLGLHDSSQADGPWAAR